MNISAFCLMEQLTARGDEEDEGTPGSVTSELMGIGYATATRKSQDRDQWRPSGLQSP